MLVLVEKDCVRLAVSTVLTQPDGESELGSCEENLPFFRAENSRVLIGGSGAGAAADLDALRPVSLPLRGQLNLPALLRKVLPEAFISLDKLGRLSSGELQSVLVLARDGNAYMGSGLTDFRRLDTDTALFSDVLLEEAAQCALLRYEDLPAREKIVRTYETLGAYLRKDVFPLAVTDTKTLRVQWIGGGK